jgi:hypothetical protein
LIQQARQKTSILQDSGGFEDMIERVKEIEKLSEKIKGDIEVLTEAEEDLEVNSHWPASVWKKTENVRRHYPNDPRVVSIVKKMSFYSIIITIRPWLIGVTLVCLLIWWFYTAFIK